MSYKLMVSVAEGIIEDEKKFISEFSDFQRNRNHPEIKTSITVSENKGKVISLAIVDDKTLDLNLIDILDFVTELPGMEDENFRV